jgi:hypothetical protein
LTVFAGAVTVVPGAVEAEVASVVATVDVEAVGVENEAFTPNFNVTLLLEPPESVTAEPGK